MTWFPLSWVLDSVSLAAKISYGGYTLIDRHFKAQPQNALAPLFAFVEPSMRR